MRINKHVKKDNENNGSGWKVWVKNMRAYATDERLPFEAYKSAFKEGLPGGLIATATVFALEQSMRFYWKQVGMDISDLPNPAITYAIPISTFLLSRLYRLGSNTHGHSGLSDSVFPNDQEYHIRFLNGVTTGGLIASAVIKVGLETLIK